jgi:hypothetical protein
MKKMAAVLFAFAVMASGCSESTADGDGGAGGTAGSGGSAGSGGTAGSGGSAGSGGTGGSAGSGGTAGSGGSAGSGGTAGAEYTPEEIDTICRTWCGSTEPNGPDCNPRQDDPEDCYERWCLNGCYHDSTDCYDGPCVHPFIAIRECELSLMCNDEFGDCESLEEPLTACRAQQNTGVRFCSFVEECGEVSESECLARYDDPKCWREWDRHVGCHNPNAEGNRCDMCVETLAQWEACQNGPFCETTEDCPQGQVCFEISYCVAHL